MRGDGTIEHLTRNTVLQVRPGDRLRTYSAGGGGVGPASRRDPMAVEEDVVNGLVSIAAAEEEYAVVIDPVTQAADLEATRQLRESRSDGV